MPKNKWESWAEVIAQHPRPWCSGIDTQKMRGGIIDANGKIVLKDSGSNADKNRSAMLAYAVNELSDEAIKSADGLPVFYR